MTDTATPQEEIQEVQPAEAEGTAQSHQPHQQPNADGRPPRAPRQPRQQQRPQRQKPKQAAQPQRARKVHPALEKLFELYPGMFGARFLPLKLGVFQDLLEKHPDDFKKDELKVALGLHARSTRYLEAVAAGLARHDLDGNAVEPVAPEHVHHAILELHRRRVQRNPGEDLRPQLVARIARAVEASGLDREAYAVLVRSRDEETNAVLDEALAELARQAAKREALLRAFEASGRSSEHEFAEMYGMDADEVARTLARARTERQPAAPAA
ncbi:ProQ/FINO family protein [Variovorax paradoxus]|uniref:ProQ/FINO family protein n=1 Tax=Variovorax paradoxus TaxID=34073 RepID=UPI0029C981A0|nr:ProQ/FINO family protein [Variovorax paradoxus]